jgi:1-deoxy-D-xylulose-5-phosphate synthase
MSHSQFPLIEGIERPADLRFLAESDLLALTVELRNFLLDSVGKTGGHLASSLGVVELTVALHYVFNTPEDKLVWDVGHQAYVHKILTGRWQQMDSLRKIDGLSGFTRRAESIYDPFGAGHASTSISAALGMAMASSLKGESNRAIAIIGDGALTGGMAFEGLNHAGAEDANLVVILNDNERSISENVGGMARYLGRLLSCSPYRVLREGSRKAFSPVPGLWQLAKRAEEHIKGMIVPGTLFEELGFNYIGPVDGHNLSDLLRALRTIKQLSGPQFLHIITQKGKGYPPAEEDPLTYHGVSTFNPDVGKQASVAEDSLSYSEVFGDWLCHKAANDQHLVAITPAMSAGSGMEAFAKQFPRQFIDVGIAEQHAVTLSGGLASEGFQPVVAIYSTFLQRGYDQLIHDIALQNLNVTFAIDRAGLVGADGPTHAGTFDLSFLRCIPNMLIMMPSDEEECWQMLETAYRHPGPAAVRYPRGKGPGVALSHCYSDTEVGRAKVLRSSTATVSKVAILSFGSMLETAQEVADSLGATLVNMRFVKPLDAVLLQQLATEHELLVTLEEHAVMGGAGSAVLESLTAQRLDCQVLVLGLPDEFIEHGEVSELLRRNQLDSAGIRQKITQRLA